MGLTRNGSHLLEYLSTSRDDTWRLWSNSAGSHIGTRSSADHRHPPNRHTWKAVASHSASELEFGSPSSAALQLTPHRSLHHPTPARVAFFQGAVVLDGLQVSGAVSVAESALGPPSPAGGFVSDAFAVHSKAGSLT